MKKLKNYLNNAEWNTFISQGLIAQNDKFFKDISTKVSTALSLESSIDTDAFLKYITDIAYKINIMSSQDDGI